MSYTLDKLVVYMRVSAGVVDDMVNYWNHGGDRYGDILISWIGRKPSMCRHNYTIQTEVGESWFFGVGKYGDSPNEFWQNVKLEFNPAKMRGSKWFENFYDKMISSAKYVDFKRFDVAIDIPVARSRLQLLKDKRRYSLLEYSAENKTEYLGVRSNHGQVKLYNKAMEQKLDCDLTRLEITLDYDNCSWNEFQRIFPKALDLQSITSSGDLQGTDLVLYLACGEHPEYLRMLDKRKRKKIEQLLATTAQFIKPDKFLYETILTEILAYGNRVTPEMWAEFTEIDEDIPAEWKPKQFQALTGEQEEMK